MVLEECSLVIRVSQIFMWADLAKCLSLLLLLLIMMMMMFVLS